MAAETKRFTTIDEYIQSYPPEIQEILVELRETIRQAAPESTETISYGMPTFKLKRNLVHFAAYKKHIGFYPTPSAVEAFAAELSSYEVSKGTVRFPLNEPLPFDLVTRIVRFRVEEERSRT